MKIYKYWNKITYKGLTIIRFIPTFYITSNVYGNLIIGFQFLSGDICFIFQKITFLKKSINK